VVHVHDKFVELETAMKRTRPAAMAASEAAPSTASTATASTVFGAQAQPDPWAAAAAARQG
jgi:hypothetical protein